MSRLEWPHPAFPRQQGSGTVWWPYTATKRERGAAPAPRSFFWGGTKGGCSVEESLWVFDPLNSPPENQSLYLSTTLFDTSYHFIPVLYATRSPQFIPSGPSGTK